MRMDGPIGDNAMIHVLPLKFKTKQIKPALPPACPCDEKSMKVCKFLNAGFLGDEDSSIMAPIKGSVFVTALTQRRKCDRLER